MGARPGAVAARSRGAADDAGEVTLDRKVIAVAAKQSLQTLRKGARITGGPREALASDVRKRYESGESIRALADETGRSYGFIHRLLADADVPFRPRGGATRGGMTP